MNILHISSNYPPDIGGPAASVPYLARELMRRGHDCTVLTKDVKNQPSYSETDGLRVYRSAHIPGNFYNPVIAFTKSLPMGLKARKLIENNRVDIVHSHDINVSAIAGLIGTKFKDTKKVTKLPGPLSWELMSLLRWKGETPDEFFENKTVIARLIERVQKTICNGYDAVVAPSNYMKRLLIEHTEIDSSKVHVLYNGVISEPFSAEEVTKVRESLLGKKKHLVMSACRMMPWKGLEYLIEAYKDFSKDVCLVLVGDGPTKEKLEKTAQGTDIRFIGRLSHRDVQVHMRAADAYVMPSLFENFPLAALDCLVTQTPIVATKIGGIPEILTDEKTSLFIEPRDPVAITESVKRLLSDKRLYDAIREKQKETYEKFFWKNISEDYIKFYERVIG
jgi:glycosyltransferase involved in cell wall biosynthesis